ncbi:hypothetical protein EDEG_04088, partial [Edhazardia aedis USNM 41457]
FNILIEFYIVAAIFRITNFFTNRNFTNILLLASSSAGQVLILLCFFIRLKRSVYYIRYFNVNSYQLHCIIIMIFIDFSIVSNVFADRLIFTFVLYIILFLFVIFPIMAFVINFLLISASFLNL